MKTYVVFMLAPNNGFVARLIKSELPVADLQKSLDNPKTVTDLVATLGLPYTPECLLAVVETNETAIEIVCE